MEAEITISGNVGTHVEYREHERFDGRATFNVGVTPSVWRNGAWKDHNTLWFRVTCWRRLAQNVRDSIRRGDPVRVTGRLRLHQWVNEAGERRERLEVDATSVSHELRRGTTTFVRSRRSEPDEPFESDAEAARLEALEEHELAELEALEALAALADGEPVAVAGEPVAVAEASAG